MLHEVGMRHEDGFFPGQCDQVTCENGGRCINLPFVAPPPANKTGRRPPKRPNYHCECPDGYTGQDCQCKCHFGAEILCQDIYVREGLAAYMLHLIVEGRMTLFEGAALDFHLQAMQFQFFDVSPSTLTTVKS